MTLIGSRRQFGFELGPDNPHSKQQQDIWIWAGGRKVNPIDPSVYLPTFYGKAVRELERLRTMDLLRQDISGAGDDKAFKLLCDEENSQHRVLEYDVSTAPAECYFFGDEKSGRLLMKYWDARHTPREEIDVALCVSLPKDQFVVILRQLTDRLNTVWD